jgi:Asp-tRNA(Asn)/Glu-tRNA(Gln) amidotransferase A subunit family amidase
VLFVDGAAMILRQAYTNRESEMYSIVREIIEAADKDPALTGDRLFETLFARDVVRTRFLAQMDRYPVLLCPVNAIPAFRHRERSWSVDGREVQYLDQSSYCQWFNLLGNPAAVVPVNRSDEGLPIGVQIVGRPWEEERILAVAAALEREVAWTARPSL